MKLYIKCQFENSENLIKGWGPKIVQIFKDNLTCAILFLKVLLTEIPYNAGTCNSLYGGWYNVYQKVLFFLKMVICFKEFSLNFLSNDCLFKLLINNYINQMFILKFLLQKVRPWQYLQNLYNIQNESISYFDLRMLIDLVFHVIPVSFLYTCINLSSQTLNVSVA